MSDPGALHALQEWMQNALIQPSSAAKQEVDQRFKASNRLSASERLAIYQRSYISRLRLCLAEQFPASRHALGADLFDQFARTRTIRRSIIEEGQDDARPDFGRSDHGE